MPTLEELRDKWFLKFNSSVASFPPVARHKNSTVSDYTDGNLVTPLIDGKNYMAEWHNSIKSLQMEAGSELYHAAFVLDGVRTLGEDQLTSNALDVLREAHEKGVTVYPLFDGFNQLYSTNYESVKTLRANGISRACFDIRFPSTGSNHQKFVCFKTQSDAKAILGSIDIFTERWDRNSHADADQLRPTGVRPTHDIGVLVQGPAVTDIEITFRERWNDSSRESGLGWPLFFTPLALPPPPEIATLVSSPAKDLGTHSVQALHTYGQVSSLLDRYTWSSEGEFTIWASYINAIKTATNYIYIEDQYFFPFGEPPCFNRKGNARDSDLFWQLGEAIKRGVKVVVLVPSSSEEGLLAPYQVYHRNIGVHYLATIAASHQGDFVIASLVHGSGSNTRPTFVHSKLMICDDEFVLIGAANFNQRSMTHDSELHIGVVDSTNQFALELRKLLWGEHLQRFDPSGQPDSSLDNPDDAFTTFKGDVQNSAGRVRAYATADPGADPPFLDALYRLLMNHQIDPYAGPPRD